MNEKIYIYQVRVDSLPELIMNQLLGMRYMALVGQPWPEGKIVAYGYTQEGTYRKARRKQARRTLPQGRLLVAEWNEAGEQVQ